MSAIVFRLRNVPADEAEDVRALLDRHAIGWYETTAGNWGIAMPALWVADEAELPRARELIETYGEERARRMRDEAAARRAAGELPTLASRLRERPLASLGTLAFCAFLLYAMIGPFLRFVGGTGD